MQSELSYPGSLPAPSRCSCTVGNPKESPLGTTPVVPPCMMFFPGMPLDPPLAGITARSPPLNCIRLFLPGGFPKMPGRRRIRPRPWSLPWPRPDASPLHRQLFEQRPGLGPKTCRFGSGLIWFPLPGNRPFLSRQCQRIRPKPPETRTSPPL